MAQTYSVQPSGGPAGLPPKVGIVVADCNSGVFSPALNAALGAASPTARAALCANWIQALVEHGVDQIKAAVFVTAAEARVAATLAAAAVAVEACEPPAPPIVITRSHPILGFPEHRADQARRRVREASRAAR